MHIQIQRGPRGTFRRLGNRLFPLCTVLLFVGCQFDPYAHLFTTEKPQPADLAGNYRLARQTVTRDGVAAFHGKQCTLELRADGTFTATNVPPWDAESPGLNFFSTLVNGSGTWQIESVGSVDDGSGTLKTHWGVYLDSPTPKIKPVGLTGQEAPYGLIFTLGDPDAGDVMILEKIKR